MNGTTWLRRTRQMWKMNVFFVVIASAGVMLVMLIRVSRSNSDMGATTPALLALGSVLFAGAALAWLGLSIRCHECGSRPAFESIRKSEYTDWLLTLLMSQQCPNCGSSGSAET